MEGSIDRNHIFMLKYCKRIGIPTTKFPCPNWLLHADRTKINNLHIIICYCCHNMSRDMLHRLGRWECVHVQLMFSQIPLCHPQAVLAWTLGISSPPLESWKLLNLYVYQNMGHATFFFGISCVGITVLCYRFCCWLPSPALGIQMLFIIILHTILPCSSW